MPATARFASDITPHLSRPRDYSALDELHRERRAIEQGMQHQAESLLRRWQTQREQLDWGLCLFQPDWHQGVIGIPASRIKDQYHIGLTEYQYSVNLAMTDNKWQTTASMIKGEPSHASKKISRRIDHGRTGRTE